MAVIAGELTGNDPLAIDGRNLRTCDRPAGGIDHDTGEIGGGQKRREPREREGTDA